MSTSSRSPHDRLPCRRDPERWFDRANRTHALAGCLACPVRRWCAAEALSRRASEGMWAGIWIDGNLAAVEHHLRAIAQPAPPAAPPPPRRAPHAPPPRQTPPPLTIRAPADTTTSGAALVAARSSGHCEIMAPGCALSWDLVAFRRATPNHGDNQDPAACYAVCRSCQATLAAVAKPRKQRLGYLVDRGQNPAAVPFFWRQTRWMVFDAAGGAQIAAA